MKPYFDIIMPAYNAERTIKRALDTVLRQTFANWRLFVVNDGFTDDTNEIVQDYAAQDGRIYVINISARGGVAKARNFALEKTQGQYVTFLDADDYWEKDVLEQAHLYLQKDTVQVLKYGVIEEYYNKQEKLIGSNKVMPQKKCYCTQEDVQRAIMVLESYPLFGYLCNSFYNREFLLAHDLKFDNKYKTQGDFFFNLEVFNNATKLLCLPFAGYHYCKFQHSTLSNINDDAFWQLRQQKITALLDNYRKQQLLTDVVEQQIFWLYIRYVYGWLCIKITNYKKFKVLYRNIQQTSLYKRCCTLPWRNCSWKQRIMLSLFTANRSRELWMLCKIIAVCKDKHRYVFALAKR